MTLAEMLDVVEDKAGFEQLLQTLDVPAYSISSPICTGPIARREPLAVDDCGSRGATRIARSR
jgi:5-methyltetrahydropteroyltriglutamate--homocysteine methyltransferase